MIREAQQNDCRSSAQPCESLGPESRRTSAGRSTMITPLRPTKHAGSAPHRLSRRRRRTASPAVFSGTIFRLRPRLEVMEDRTLLSTFLVSNTGDSGPGSLRQAILDSNAATGATNTIDFDIPGPGVQTIAPALAPARDHQPGPDRRLLPAGLQRHAADRAERQPGRRRRRPDDHRLGRHRPRPGHQQLRQGAGILISGTGATGNWIVCQRHRHRSDRHAGPSPTISVFEILGGATTTWSAGPPPPPAI